MGKSATFLLATEIDLYPSQTKILEGGTKELRISKEALFKGVSTRFGRRTIEKCFENPDFIFCSSSVWRTKNCAIYPSQTKILEG
jgi:hypothetical protein